MKTTKTSATVKSQLKNHLILFHLIGFPFKNWQFPTAMGLHNFRLTTLTCGRGLGEGESNSPSLANLCWGRKVSEVVEVIFERTNNWRETQHHQHMDIYNINQLYIMYGTIVHVDNVCVFLKTLFEGNTSVLIKSLFNIASIVESTWLGWVDVSHQHPAVQKKKLFLQHSNFHFQLLLLQILQVSNGLLRCACSMLCFMVSQLPKQLKRKNKCQ